MTVDRASVPTLVTGPIAGSTKGYRRLADVPGARVPYRRVHLADGTHLDLYDASGPYTDPKATIDLTRGLTARPAVFADRGTQLQRARDGIVTAEMAMVALREGVRPRVVRDEVAAGRAVIPANHRHPETEPMIIGRAFRVKVGAAISDVADLVWAIRWGADTVTHVSVAPEGGTERVLRNSPVPVGSVPLVQALATAHGEPAALTWNGYRDSVIEHAERGVDYMTVHAGLRLAHVALTADRLGGVVNHGGAVMAEWCLAHGSESFLYEHFDELLRVFAHYDVTLSLGASLQPASIADANDAAQMAELRTLGELAKRANSLGVQVMIESPGRLPMHKIAESMRLQEQLCRSTPFFAKGPLTTDIAAGHDHVASAIGAAAMAQAGGSLLSCVIADDQFAVPDRASVKASIVAHRIAAHAADLAKGHPRARERDDALARARLLSHPRDELALALDPDGARARAQRAPIDLRQRAAAGPADDGPFGAPMTT